LLLFPRHFSSALPFEKLSSKPLLSAAFFRCGLNAVQFVFTDKKHFALQEYEVFS
jgi:hypothetical protein